jgi:hypothetical protein
MQLTYDKNKLASLCELNKVNYLGLFGSYARGEADAQSDVDLLVDFLETPSLLKHVGLEYEFSEDVFNNKRVDLVTRKSLKKDFAPRISKELVTLYEKR